MADVNSAYIRHLRNQHKQAQRGEPRPTGNDAIPGRQIGSEAQATTSARYSPDVYDEPRSYEDTPESSTSGESMNNHGENLTPPESPAQQDSPTAEVNLGRLSLEHDARVRNPPVAPRGRGVLSAGPLTASKRPASSEPARELGRQSPNGHKASRNSHAAGQRSPRGALRGQRHGRNGPNASKGQYQQPPWHDSGYDTMPSRASTFHQVQQTPKEGTSHTPKADIGTAPALADPTMPSAPRPRGILTLPQKARYPGLILQPDSSPISEEQLTAEIKGIYAGLVMVEAKCINIDAAQAADPTAQLDPGQWQALIALHRTLLYEHHDFLMATQHPSATAPLRALPTKYSMPARMWKHGIHAFLEVLRHRRPDSQDYMLSFIYLAYQMMALLYETVPVFLDTWIECLGDLARYRMAIEEEKEPHAQWGGVAASWYIKASDRHPQVGRLYHHLAILERPSLRKFACYGKSLTCVVPFPNARDSLATLCGPIAEEAQPARPIGLLTEASFCKLQADLFLGKDESIIQDDYSKAIGLIQQPDSFRWRDCGVPLAVANISALLGYGSPGNPLRTAADFTIQQAIHRARPSGAASTPVPAPTSTDLDNSESRRLLLTAKALTLASFNTALRCLFGTASLRDSLAFVHVTLSFIHFLSLAEKETESSESLHTALTSLIGLSDIAWGDVCTFLNALAQLHPITARIVQAAQQGIWLQPERAGEGKPLPEDFSIRGLVWAYFCFCPGWFQTEEDEEWARSVETASVHKARAERSLYHGLRLAFETTYLSYDTSSRTFSTTMPAMSNSAISLQYVGAVVSDGHSHRAAASSKAPSSPVVSAPRSSSSDGDYVHVRRPSQPAPQAPAKSWAAVAKAGAKPMKATKPSKQRPNVDNVKVVDPDTMHWEAEA